MRNLATLLMLVVLAGATQPTERAGNYPALMFSRDPQLRGVREEVQIGLLDYDAKTKGSTIWAQHSSKSRNGMVITRWTESRTCPALIESMQILRSLEMPRPDPPGIPALASEITVDGVSYNLEGYGAFGAASARYALSSNLGTPLALWIDATLENLQPCWVNLKPTSRPSPA